MYREEIPRHLSPTVAPSTIGTLTEGADIPISRQRKGRGSMGSKINFLREFIKEPGSVGAVAPSGSVLAARMLDGISLDQSSVVVELGPGTGVFTAEILTRISTRTRFLAVEKKPDLRPQSATTVHQRRNHRGQCSGVVFHPRRKTTQGSRHRRFRTSVGFFP